MLRSKSYLRDIPIIMLTSRDSKLSEIRGRMAGATVYLRKPFKTQDIVETVGRFLKPTQQRLPPSYRSQAW